MWPSATAVSHFRAMGSCGKIKRSASKTPLPPSRLMDTNMLMNPTVFRLHAMLFCLAVAFVAMAAPTLAPADDFPPGWLPVERLDGKLKWDDDEPPFTEKVHLYLPSDKPVRGVFICFVFHSADPREVADAWNFALVTITRDTIKHLGIRDRKTGKRTLGYKDQGMGLVLKYLEHAAKATGHKELTTVPIVGWLGQAGGHFCKDLYNRAPQRVLAWADSFGGQLRQYPELTAKVPFAFAWEIHKKDLQSRKRTPPKKPVPPQDLACAASTYGFPHGIYSKFNYFMVYLDRCIKVRLPAQMPPVGQPVKLKPVAFQDGWVGDFQPISEWNPIAKAGSKEAESFEHPSWLPDPYAAAMWRSYHSAAPDIRMTEPIIPYGRTKRGPKMGLGYGGFLPVYEPLTLQATTTGDYAKVEFYNGDQLLGTASSAPWSIDGVKFKPGLHAIYAVGIASDGGRTASQPAIAVAK